MLDKKSVEWRNRVNSVWVSNHDVPLIGECYKNGAIAGEFMVRRTIRKYPKSYKTISDATSIWQSIII